MVFKDIRYLIYSRLDIIIDNEIYQDVETNDPETDKFDYYEVIGIRAGIEYYDTYEEERLIVSLKKTANKHFENYVENCRHSDRFECPRARGK